MFDAVCGGGASSQVDDGPVGVWAPADGATPPGISPALRWKDPEGGGDVAAPATADADGNATMWALVAASFAKFGSNRCVGWRTLVKREFEGKFEKLTLADEFEWWTYSQLEDRVLALAAGLPLSKGDRVLLYAETQRDWMVAALACFKRGAVVVTAYATLGEEGVLTALTQTDAKLCVCDAKLLKILLAAAAKLPKTLEMVVTIGEASDDASALGVPTTTLDELQAKGKTSNSATTADDEPSASDLAVIMYTSGTTGTSKGVCISHQSAVAMTLSYPKANPLFHAGDSYVAYLPLAHIMELTIEMWLFSIGASMGYGSPHTLTDTGVKLAQGCRGDAPLLRPTAMLFAPAVLDKVYAAVKRKVEGSAVKEFLFAQALSAGKKRFERGQTGCGPVWDAIVMKKIQALIGGRVRYMASGSAPLTPEVQVFIQSCFNCPVRQGYGCTETCGGSVIGVVADNTPAQVGPPTPCTYLRLRDWTEGNYTFADGQRGEILLGGPSIADGYYVDPKTPDPAMIEKNETDFVTIDGVKYFCTGDIGQIDASGRLKIIDRKKDLFKGASGEYVALSKVEAALKLNKLVEMPFVYGKTGEASVIALVSPQPAVLVDLAQKELGMKDKDAVALSKDATVAQAVAAALKAQCKAAGLHAFETPKAFKLCIAADGSPPWTPDNGFLTSTMKLKRPVIAKAFQADIDAAYAAS